MFFSCRGRHTSCSRDGSSGVCSSDLSYFAGSADRVQVVGGLHLEEAAFGAGMILLTTVLYFGFASNQERSEERREGKSVELRWRSTRLTQDSKMFTQTTY